MAGNVGTCHYVRVDGSTSMPEKHRSREIVNASAAFRPLSCVIRRAGPDDVGRSWTAVALEPPRLNHRRDIALTNRAIRCVLWLLPLSVLDARDERLVFLCKWRMGFGRRALPAEGG